MFESRYMRRLAPALAALLVAAPLTSAVAQEPPPGAVDGCPQEIDASTFASPKQLRDWSATQTGFGMYRSSASDSQQRVVDWLDREMRTTPGMSTRTIKQPIERWQPKPKAPDGGRDLERAGELRVLGKGGRKVPTIGAVPYSLPTSGKGKQGRLTYIPAGQPITAANARGRIVIRDVPSKSLPYYGFAALAWYMTPDVLPLLPGKYERPYMATDGPLAEELKAAGKAGAAGMVVAFDIPRAQLRGYFDPHKGTHFSLPAVFAGVDEAVQLKRLAAKDTRAQVRVHAKRDQATARTLIATLPGQGPERMVFTSHADGATWLQDNGPVAMLALARHFAALPLKCRPRTIEFAFGTGHLHLAANGIEAYAKELDQAYDKGTVAFVFTLEHMGAREVLPVPRTGKPGRTLKFTGAGEPTGLSIGEAPTIVTAATKATIRRKLDRTVIQRGTSLPGPTVPPHCAPGGDGTPFWVRLIPTLQLISGPWTLWAPAYGERAVDFDRMRNQALMAGDVALALDDIPRQQIAGPILTYRAMRAAGAPTCK